MYFAPSSGVNGTLSLRVVNDTGSDAIEPLPENSTEGNNGTFGITGIVEFNDSAVLAVRKHDDGADFRFPFSVRLELFEISLRVHPFFAPFFKTQSNSRASRTESISTDSG